MHCRGTTCMFSHTPSCVLFTSLWLGPIKQVLLCMYSVCMRAHSLHLSVLCCRSTETPPISQTLAVPARRDANKTKIIGPCSSTLNPRLGKPFKPQSLQAKGFETQTVNEAFAVLREASRELTDRVTSVYTTWGFRSKTQHLSGCRECLRA